MILEIFLVVQKSYINKKLGQTTIPKKIKSISTEHDDSFTLLD